MESDLVSAAVADVTGRRVADVSVDPNGADGPVEVVRGVIERACASAGVELARLSALVIGPSSAGHRPVPRRRPPSHGDGPFLYRTDRAACRRKPCALGRSH